MCDERMTTVHGHLVNEAFQEEEWHDLILLNGLHRLTEPDDDCGTLLPFDEFCRDFVGSHTEATEHGVGLPAADEFDVFAINSSTEQRSSSAGAEAVARDGGVQ